MVEELSKEKVIELLKKKNLPVKLENGIIMLVCEPDKAETQIEQYLSTLQEIGYDCSFGYRGSSSADAHNFMDNTETEIESDL